MISVDSKEKEKDNDRLKKEKEEFYAYVNEKREDYLSEREKFISNLLKEKYRGVEFNEQEKKANVIFIDRVRPEFKFKEDFYSNLAMKYKNDIEKHTFFKDLEAMPKGALLHHHMTDCIDRHWLRGIIEKNGEHIYQRNFQKTFPKSKYPLRLVYTLEKTAEDKPFKDVLKEWEQGNPGKDLDYYLLENLTMLPDELSRAENNPQCWERFMPKYFFALPLICNEKFYKDML